MFSIFTITEEEETRRPNWSSKKKKITQTTKGRGIPYQTDNQLHITPANNLQDQPNPTHENFFNRPKIKITFLSTPCSPTPPPTEGYFFSKCASIKSQTLPKLWFVGWIKHASEISKKQKYWTPMAACSSDCDFYFGPLNLKNFKAFLLYNIYLN